MIFDYNGREFIYIEVKYCKLTDKTLLNSLDMILDSKAMRAYENFYLTDQEHGVILCLTQDEIDTIECIYKIAPDIVSYTITNVTDIILKGLDGYDRLYKLFIEDSYSLIILNNYLKVNSNFELVFNKMINVGKEKLLLSELNILTSVKNDIIENTSFTSDLVFSNNLKIYFFAFTFYTAESYKRFDNLFSTLINTLPPLLVENSFLHCSDIEYDLAEEGVFIANEYIKTQLDHVTRFIHYNDFKYEIIDLTEDVLYHRNLPDIYFKLIETDKVLFNHIDQIVAEISNLNIILEKITSFGTDILFPSEKAILESI
jgi:hypothetical protein